MVDQWANIDLFIIGHRLCEGNDHSGAIVWGATIEVSLGKRYGGIRNRNDTDMMMMMMGHVQGSINVTNEKERHSLEGLNSVPHHTNVANCINLACAQTGSIYIFYYSININTLIHLIKSGHHRSKVDQVRQ